MKLYNCNVNVGGPVLHLIPKANISAAEVALLLFLHGDDSVRNIEQTQEVDVPHGALYDYLSSRYGEKHVKDKYGEKSRKMNLPEEIDFDALYANPEDLDGEADLLEDPTKAALEAAAINQANAEPARKTLTLKQPA